MSDVYLYGMITPSIVHILHHDFDFPKANGYAEIGETLISVGGEAANSAVILAKLGLSVKLDGNWLNRRRADHVFGLLNPFGIDLSRLNLVDSGGTDEFVIADRISRTVFGNYATFHSGPRQWNEPQPNDIQVAKIVCVDPYFHDESRRVAELCVELGKPYVTLDCECDDYIARNAAAVVISHELRDRVYLAQDQREVFERYLNSCQGLVIFTFGQEPLWYGRRGHVLRQHKPYVIEPVDTTGAGDAFRGAIAYGLLQGYDDEKTVDFASAVAANVCLSYPHALNAPGLETVLAFIAKYRTDSVTVP